MRIIYFGSDDFGIPSLEELKKKHNLAGVITAPDRPKGRGLKVSCTAVKDWAVKNNVPVYQPEYPSAKNFTDTLKDLKPELIVLISYGKILPVSVLEIPSVAAINVHPSLLPKYRGAAPMEWALINGKRETGITVITMHGKMDTGDVIMQKKVVIDETEDIFSLKKNLSEIAPGMLVESIEKIKQGISPIPQKGVPSYARKLAKEDGLIRWGKTAVEIHNLIRGTKEWPGAYTYINGKYLKIFDSEPLPYPPHPGPLPQGACPLPHKGERGKEAQGMERMGGNIKAGEVISIDKNSIYVACGEGMLQIKEVQMEGKKRMPAQEFLKGHKIQKGDRFSEKKQ